MKSIALLATALFLASAPAPDPNTMSELSAGFLSPGKAQPLMAAEPGQASWQVGFESSTTLASGILVKESTDQTAKQEMLAD